MKHECKGCSGYVNCEAYCAEMRHRVGWLKREKPQKVTIGKCNWHKYVEARRKKDVATR